MIDRGIYLIFALWLGLAFVAGWSGHVLFQYLTRPVPSQVAPQNPQKGALPLFLPNPNQKGK